MKVPQYDIFAGTFGEDTKWLEAVEGAGLALTRLKLLAAEMPGVYFIFCRETQRVVASMDTTRLGQTTSAKSASGALIKLNLDSP